MSELTSFYKRAHKVPFSTLWSLKKQVRVGTLWITSNWEHIE